MKNDICWCKNWCITIRTKTPGGCIIKKYEKYLQNLKYNVKHKKDSK